MTPRSLPRGIVVIAVVFLAAQPLRAALPPFYEPPVLGWTYAQFGMGIGRPGLVAKDLDKDGNVEIVVGSWAGWGDAWRILRHGAGDAYETIWTSRWYRDGIVRLALEDADHDGVSEIYVALPDGTIEIYAGAVPGPPVTIATGLALTEMAVADADGDGGPELILTDTLGLSCRGLVPPYDEKWWLPTAGGFGLAVGQLDDDAAPEIVVGTSCGLSGGCVIDGATRLVQWSYADGFGTRIRCGDVDGDGRDEIVGDIGWYDISAFDADSQTLKWQIPIGSDIGAVRLVDTDGDAVAEIIVGEGQGGHVLCFDAATLELRWAIANPASGVSEVEIADVNADGALEVLWGGGSGSTAPDYLFVADLAERTIEWRSVDLLGPLSAIGTGDVDGDGKAEIVMISYMSESGYDDGIIHIFDGQTHELEWTGDSAPGSLAGVRAVAVGDVDADGVEEIVYNSWQLGADDVVVFDGVTHAVKRRGAGTHGSYSTAFEIADVDGDGDVEIVAAQWEGATGFPGGSIAVFDGATMAEEWRSPDLGSFLSEVSDVAVGCVDGDGRPEIIATLPSGRVYVFDGTTHELEWRAEFAAHSAEIADADGDGAPEILLGRDGAVEAYNGVTHEFESSRPVGAGKIVGLRAAGVFAGSAWFFASDGGRLLHFPWSDPAATWQSQDLGTDVARYNHLALADVDADGTGELLVGSSYALYEFDLGAGNPRVASVVRAGADPVSSNTADFVVTFSEAVTGVGTAAPFSDFALVTTGVTGASITGVSGSADTYTVSVQTGDGVGDGTIRLDVVDDDSIQDDGGRPLGGAGIGNGDFTNGEVYTIWGCPRVVSVVRTDPNPAESTSVGFKVVFSEPVSGVDLAPPFGDFALATTGVTTGAITAASGSGDTYVVTVSVAANSGNGTIRLDVLDDDSIADALGNPLAGAGAGNGDFTAGQEYAVLTIPPPLAPAGNISTTKPTYRWTRVPGATRYRYQLFKGARLVYTRTVSPAACAATECSNTPTTAIGMGARKWRVRSMIGGAWTKYSAYTAFTVGPRAGYWSSPGLEFWVTPEFTAVEGFAIYLRVTGCGDFKITRLLPAPIAKNRFAFSGPFYASGTFSSPTRVHGTLGLRRFYIPECDGYLTGGPFSWAGTWKSSPPPGLDEAAVSTPASVRPVHDPPAAAFSIDAVDP